MKKLYERAYSLKVRLKAMELLRDHTVTQVAYKLGVSRQTIYDWLERYNGTEESLSPLYCPPAHHKNEHTEKEIDIIKYVIENNENAGFCELFSKLVYEFGYERSPSGFFKKARNLGYLNRTEKRKLKRKNQIYFTPKLMGKKWQLDVKFIPRECSIFGKKFYQYTVIDEATRQRFIFPFAEYNQENTILFIRMAIVYFGYTPIEIQTDNGREFTNNLIRNCETASVGVFDLFLNSVGIHHKLIRPATPRHNGKVERSHRNDDNRFYNKLKFASYGELIIKMHEYLERSNNIMSRMLHPINGKSDQWMSPNEKRAELERLGLVA